MLGLARKLGDRETVAIGLLNLAMVEIGRGSVERVRQMLLDVLEIVAETGSKPVGQSVLEVCAGLAVLCQDWPHAGRFYAAAEAQALRTGLHRDPADQAFLAPMVAKAQAGPGGAAFAASEDAARELAYDDAVAAVLRTTIGSWSRTMYPSSTVTLVTLGSRTAGPTPRNALHPASTATTATISNFAFIFSPLVSLRREAYARAYSEATQERENGRRDKSGFREQAPIELRQPLGALVANQHRLAERNAAGRGVHVEHHAAL